MRALGWLCIHGWQNGSLAAGLKSSVGEGVAFRPFLASLKWLWSIRTPEIKLVAL